MKDSWDDIRPVREGELKKLTDDFKENSYAKIFKGEPRGGAWNSIRFRKLYWLEIKLSGPVKIYEIEYDKIFIMPYTFGYTQEELKDKDNPVIRNLSNYELEDKKYINNGKINTDITTGNSHPKYATDKVLKYKGVKQLVLMRNIPTSHYGCLYGVKLNDKDREKDFIIIKTSSDKYYVPKKCIYVLNEGESVDVAFKNFLKQIGL